MKYIRTHEGVGTLESGEAVFYALQEYRDRAHASQPFNQLRGFIRPTSGPCTASSGTTLILRLSDGRKLRLDVESSDVHSATVVAEDELI